MTLASPKRFTVAAFAVAGLALVFALAIYLRTINVDDLEHIRFSEVMWWQAASWLPLLVLAFAVELYPRARVEARVRAFHPLAHLAFSIAFAFVLTFWFKAMSEAFSPYLGFRGTRFGVFPWFFIFWFFIQGLLYWVGTFFYGYSGGAPAPAAGARGKGPKKLVVKSGKRSEVVDPKDVRWVEAQDYYSVLHLADHQAWVKMTMAELEKTLDPETFVRIHRSTIINVNFLKQLEKGTPGKYVAILADGARRPISRVGWRALKPMLRTSKA